MFCINCGKEINNEVTFCPFCGFKVANEQINELTKDTIEEFIIYKATKHWITLLPLVFIIPACLLLFSGLFLFGIFFLFLAVYPVLRFMVDKIEVTNKSFNLQVGVLNTTRINMPLNKINTYYIKQSLIGHILNYGSFVIQTAAEQAPSCYNYIKNPNEIIEIITNIDKYKNQPKINITKNRNNLELSNEDKEYLDFRRNFNIEDEE